MIASSDPWAALKASPLVGALPEQSVLQHNPLVSEEGKTLRESWAHLQIAFQADILGGLAELQPNQAIPVWKRVPPSGGFQMVNRVQLTVKSAFVFNGRYMIAAGGNVSKSHPNIMAWETDRAGVSGKGAELLYPGGIRRLRLGHSLPVIAPFNEADFDEIKSTARLFHGFARHMSLQEAPLPLALAVPDIKGVKPPGGAAAGWATNVVTGELEIVHKLPFPIITSLLESKVLKDYPEAWQENVLKYLEFYSVDTVYLVRTDSADVPGPTEPYQDRIPIIYRQAIVDGDIGMATLDVEVYDRMLPFAGEHLDMDMFLSREESAAHAPAPPSE